MDPFDLRLWSHFIEAGGKPSQAAVTEQITIDSRRISSQNALFVALEGKTEDGHRFIPHAIQSGARFIIAKIGWTPQEDVGNAMILRVESPLTALQQIAAAYREQLPCRILAITGSYGKTMVKDLLYDMLSTTHAVTASPESFNSQIGVPLSLLTIRKEHTLALIEAAISKKSEMHTLSHIIKANYGIVTHIGKKHLATLGNLQTAAQEMLDIFVSPPKKQWAILPQDVHILSDLSKVNADCHFWTEHSSQLPHACFTTQDYAARMPYRVDFPDGHRHEGHITSGFYYFLDLINITAKAAWLLGVSSSAISDVLKSYVLEPTRTEIWKSPLGTVFINDTYCSDPQSVDVALKHFQQSHDNNRRIFVFGGMRNHQTKCKGDYKRIGKAIHAAKIHSLILFGPHDFQPLIDEVQLLSPHINISRFPSYEHALHTIKNQLTHQDTVLIKGENKYSIDHITETFHDSICSNQCIINLAAISQNLQTLRHKIPPNNRCMVMVKALAYGTDDIRMAKFLETCGIDILGVSYVDEGVALKRAAVSQTIFVINAAPYEAAKVVKWGLEIGISDHTLIDAVAAAAALQRKTVKVHLHVDTGMSRFGCRPEEALSLAKQIVATPFLELEGIMTHFACADDPLQDSFTLAQTQQFDLVIAELEAHGIRPPWRHAANSSGAIRFHFPQYNMIRLGLAVYGLYSSQATKDALELRLALSLISRIVGINMCKKGETISYGRSYRVERDTQNFAVLPIGYFDGLHRNYSGRGLVIIRGQKAPMVGKICMDFMMVDVTDIPHAAPGDAVLIFGEDEYGYYLSPEELAIRGDSIVHELITCLGPRIQRIFVYEEAHRNTFNHNFKHEEKVEK